MDANNLYGWATSQYLPTGGFKWKKGVDIDLAKYTEESKKEMILAVDFEYNQELHDLHYDYPLAAEKIKVQKEMLPQYCERIREKYGITIGQVRKLISTLKDTNNYVLHYRNLQLHLDLGLKVIKKVHSALEFHQSSWLQKYIDFNTDMHKNTANDFEKDFFKLINNSVFGRTLENV